MRHLLTALIVSIVFLTVGCGQSAQYERSEKLMGTYVTLKATGVEAQAAVDESFDRLSVLIDEIMSDVKNVNAAAGSDEFVKLSPEVFEMLTTAQRYSELTDGAFDVTIGAAVDIWRVARQNKELPAPNEIEAVKNLVGFRHLQLNATDRSARLDMSGVKLNLGGIGKGFCADVVKQIFERHGISDGLIDFGSSSIYAFGKKTIGIKNPRGTSETVETIELTDAALSTSGDYEQFFEVDGRRYHHIIDPKTCMPTDNGLASVTVTVDGSTDNCGTLADILSTSLLITGEERGKELLKNLPLKIDTIMIKTEPST